MIIPFLGNDYNDDTTLIIKSKEKKINISILKNNIYCDKII